MSAIKKNIEYARIIRAIHHLPRAKSAHAVSGEPLATTSARTNSSGLDSISRPGLCLGYRRALTPLSAARIIRVFANYKMQQVDRIAEPDDYVRLEIALLSSITAKYRCFTKLLFPS